MDCFVLRRYSFKDTDSTILSPIEYIVAAVLSKSGDIYLVFQFTSLGVSS